MKYTHVKTELIKLDSSWDPISIRIFPVTDWGPTSLPISPTITLPFNEILQLLISWLRKTPNRLKAFLFPEQTRSFTPAEVQGV